MKIQNKIKLLLTRKFNNDQLNQLQKLNHLYDIIIPKKYDNNEMIELIKLADASVGLDINNLVLNEAKKLKYHQFISAGVDNIELNKFFNKKIKIANTHSNAKYVAEYSLAILLDFLKKITIYDNLSKNYISKNKFREGDLYSDTLFNKRIGIVGYGNIGKNIKKLILPFSKYIFINSKHKKNKSYKSIKYLLMNMDIIFLCVPLTNDTKNFINSDYLKILNKELVIVNISRAEIIEPNFLKYIIKEKKIKSYLTDVNYNLQNLNKNLKNFFSINNLNKLNNVIISQHRAGYLGKIPPNLIDVVENLKNYAKGKKLNNLISINKGY